MLADMATISSYSLSIDSWTSVMNIGYLAVTAHRINKDWERKNFFLGVTHVSRLETVEFIGAMVSNTIQSWNLNITDVVNITSDGAANVHAAVCNELQVQWLYCIAHALNHAICLALDDPGFKPLMKKAKKLVKTFKNSPLAAQLLQDLLELCM